MAIWSEFRLRQYRKDDHREEAPYFKKRKPVLTRRGIKIISSLLVNILLFAQLFAQCKRFQFTIFKEFALNNKRFA